jgi:OOP family OmpA-OmpF porin
VRKFIIAQGVDEDRLDAKGYGEDQPVASNETEEGRRKNRRVEFQLKGRQ